MTIFVAEIDTTGPLREGPLAAGFQPRIVRAVAAIYTDGGAEVSSIDVTIKPEGWSVPPNVAEMHGTTTELAKARGIPIKTALSTIVHLAGSADVLVSYNADYFAKVMQGELERNGVNRPFPTPGQEARDVMRASMGFCKLPRSKGSPEDFRFPKLAEACRILLKEENVIQENHDARLAAKSTYCLYQELRRRGAFS